MLGAPPEAEQPADTSLPGDPQAGTHPGKTAERPQEGGGAEESLLIQRLQRQVAGLHQQLRRQEARWCAAFRHLQAQIDALKRQDRGPRGGRGAAELRGPGPGRTPAASLQPRTRPDAQPASTKVERIDWGKMVTREDGDKTVSIHLRVRGAVSAGSGPHAAGEPAALGGEEAATPPGRSLPTPSGRTPTGLAVCHAPLTEDGPAAQDTDARPSPSEGPEGESRTRAQTDGLAGPSVDTEPQNLPVEPESSRPPGAATGKEGKGGGTRSPDSKVYFCAGAQTTRSTHPSGLQVLRFPNKRTERRYPDGSKETWFPDGTVRRLSDGQEETVFPDGTSVRVERNGDRTIVLSNGQRDIHTAQFKRREYPDGTVQTVYSSGLQETKLTSGRVRVRHETGSILLAREQAPHHSQ